MKTISLLLVATLILLASCQKNPGSNPIIRDTTHTGGMDTTHAGSGDTTHTGGDTLHTGGSDSATYKISFARISSGLDINSKNKDSSVVGFSDAGHTDIRLQNFGTGAKNIYVVLHDKGNLVAKGQGDNQQYTFDDVPTVPSSANSSSTDTATTYYEIRDEAKKEITFATLVTVSPGSGWIAYGPGDGKQATLTAVKDSYKNDYMVQP